MQNSQSTTEYHNPNQCNTSLDGIVQEWKGEWKLVERHTSYYRFRNLSSTSRGTKVAF